MTRISIEEVIRYYMDITDVAQLVPVAVSKHVPKSRYAVARL